MGTSRADDEHTHTSSSSSGLPRAVAAWMCPDSHCWAKLGSVCAKPQMISAHCTDGTCGADACAARLPSRLFGRIINSELDRGAVGRAHI